jgi:hypothetical protein
MAETKTFLFHAKDSSGTLGEWDFILDEAGQTSVTQVIDNNPEFSGMSSLANKGQDFWKKIEAINIESIAFPERLGSSDEVRYTLEYKSGDKEVSKVVGVKDARTNPKIMDLILDIQNLIGKVSGKKPLF